MAEQKSSSGRHSCREVLTLNIGQCGIQLGQTLWEQYSAEHSIKPDGSDGKKQQTKDQSFLCFYQETDEKKYVPRNLMVDLEPNVIDDVKTSKYCKMFDKENLLAGKQDAANNFARGFGAVGNAMLDTVKDRLRKLVDNCENLQGFVINHAVGGGTGSGLGALILEHISCEYRKKSKFGFEIFPSRFISTCVVEPYNALLTTHYLLDFTEVSVMLDNGAIYQICQRLLDIKAPSYENLNRLIAKTISSITASLRFEGELNVDLNEFQTNLVPFTRLHFLITAMAPVVTKKKMETQICDIQGMTEACFSAENFFTTIADFDAEEDKYMAISMNYRGDVKAKQANETVQWLKINKKVTFVEWCPTGFKVGLNDEPPAVLQEDDVAPSKRNAVMLGNNTALGRVFVERICKKYDLMYSQRAFVHWYVSERMEEGEFAEAREDLEFLAHDYKDVLSDRATDEEESDASD